MDLTKSTEDSKRKSVFKAEQVESQLYFEFTEHQEYASTTKTSFLAQQRLKENLNQLRFENSLKSFKLDQLQNEIQTLQSIHENSPKKSSISSLISEISAKTEAENESTLSLNLLKTRALQIKLEWSKRLNVLSSSLDKYYSKHGKIILTRDNSLKSLNTLLDDIQNFRLNSASLKNLALEKLSSKKKVKDSYNNQIKRMVENISKLSDRQRVKQERIGEMLHSASEKVREWSAIDQNSCEMERYERDIRKKIEAVREFLAERKKDKGIKGIASVFKLYKLYNKAEFLFTSLTNRIEQLSSDISKKKKDCEGLECNLKLSKDSEFLKLPEGTVKEFTYEDNSNKPVPGHQEENHLVGLYAKIFSLLNESMSKFQIINCNCVDSSLNLLPLLQEITEAVESPKIFKHQSLRFQKPRTVGKNSTLRITNFSSIYGKPKSPEPNGLFNPETEISRLCQALFKSSKLHSNFLKSNQMISLFLEPAEVLNGKELNFDNDLFRGLVYLYKLSHKKLRQNLKKGFKRVHEAVLYAKGQIPQNFVMVPPSLIRRSRPIKLIKKTSIVVVNETARNRPENRSPMTSFTARKKNCNSSSQSPLFNTHSSLETIREIRDLDKRLSAVKKQEYRISSSSLGFNRLKLPNIPRSPPCK